MLEDAEHQTASSVVRKVTIVNTSIRESYGKPNEVVSAMGLKFSAYDNKCLNASMSSARPIIFLGNESKLPIRSLHVCETEQENKYLKNYREVAYIYITTPLYSMVLLIV